MPWRKNRQIVGKFLTLGFDPYMAESVIIPNKRGKKGRQPSKTGQERRKNTEYVDSGSC
jgi:hypothetical protein